jgi:hypothetical protein
MICTVRTCYIFQHAVHERIRLESLLDQYTSPAVVRYQLPRQLAIRLAAGQLEVLQDHPDLVNRFGLEVVGRESPPNRQSSRDGWLTQIPLCFVHLDHVKKEALLQRLGKETVKT